MELMSNQSKRTATKEECDRIEQAIEDDDVTTVQQLLADNVDVINAEIVILGGHTTPLHWASFHGRTDIVEILLEEGADVNAKDNNHQTALHCAAIEGCTDTVKILIEKGADVNAKDGIHQTPLHLAAFGGHTDIVKILIEKGADVNAKGEDDNTPLLVALKNIEEENDFDVVKILVESGAEVNVKDGYHQTPLHHSAMWGHTDIMKILIEKGADVNAKDKDDNTPLFAALKNAVENDFENCDVVKILVENGAEVNVKDGNHQTPLHHLAMWGRTDTVKILIEKGADVNAKDKDDDTPLVVALEGALENNVDNCDVVKILMENGAEVNVKDGYHQTPLHHSAMWGRTDIVKILTEKGADVNAKDEYDDTPLLVALESALENDVDNCDVVKILVENGAEVNVKDSYHQTPLHHSAKWGRTDIVKILIEKGADVNAKDEGHQTPLHCAAVGGHTDIVKILIEKGADVNAKDKDDGTPLHDAARCGHTDIVKMLLREGADVNVKNENNQTPLEVAADSGHREVVQYLVEDYHIDTSQFNEETREKINNLLEQGSPDYDKSHHDDSTSHHPGSHDDHPGSHDDHPGSQDDGTSDDPQSTTDTEQIDQLTVEDVNKGYMDGELLGPDVRVALLGAEGSGKTSLCHTLVGKKFQDTAPTEGADHMEIIVESTTNWKPLTHEEKLEDLDKQKCLESMSSAVKLKKSQPVSSTRPVKKSASTSSVLHGSSVSSTVEASSTPAVYSIQTVPPQSYSTALFSISPLVASSVTYDPLVYSASRCSTNSSEPIVPPGFDPSIFLSTPSSSVSQHDLTVPAKKQKLSLNSSLELSGEDAFVSVHTIENLKAFRESYDPKKKYVNIWDFAGQQVFQHTHGIFISEEVVCLIVFDVGLALDEVPARRYPNDRTPRRTVLETICYWMELISSRVSRPSTSDSDLSILLPTFILVGTHTDKMSPEIYLARDACFAIFLPIFRKELVGKPFSDHIAGSKNNQLFEAGSPSLFFICNLQWSRDSVVVNALKKAVMQASSITRKTRPTCYVEIERKLMLLSNHEQIGIVGLDEIAKVAKSCGLSTDKEGLLKLTQYFHHKGALLHFHSVPSLSNTVILSPSWLTKLLTYVLTSLTCLPTHPVLARYAERRQNEGLLEEELIHWSVEQFNKKESVYNRIMANMRGIPIIELFTKFQLIVDVTQSSIAGYKPRGEGKRLFLVPHLLPFEKLLPSQNFCFKILYNFPAHFIPDNLVDQLIVKCARWNNDRHYDLIRLSYQWVCLELGKYQTYEVQPNYKLDSIELTIIPDPSMPSPDEENSYKESNDLIKAVKHFIDDLMKEHMAVTFREFPVECFIPCPDCSELHIKLERFTITGSAYCPVKRTYCDAPAFSRYHKMLSTKGGPTQSGEKNVNTHSSPPSPDIQTPKMRPLLRFVIPRIAFMWRTVADFLD